MASLCFRCVSDGSDQSGQVFYAADGTMRRTGPAAAPAAPAGGAGTAAGAKAPAGKGAPLDVKPAEVADPKYSKFPYMS